MRGICLCVGFFLLSVFCGPKAYATIDTLKTRLKISYIESTQNDPDILRRIACIRDQTDGNDAVIRELVERANDSLSKVWLGELTAEGLWPDLDYASQQRGGWPPSWHIRRLSVMARSYCTPSSVYYQKPEVSKALHLGLNKWFDMELVAPNWWYNEIGGPRFMTPVLLLLEDELSEEELQKGIRYMSQAKIGMTGQNRTWLASNVLIRALLERDEELLQTARDVIVGEIRQAEEGEEGIQFDASFHQHGPQQQFGNYGLAYIQGITFWGKIFNGTRFALNPEQIKIMHRFVVYGMSKVIWRGMMDVSSCGRQLFPYTPEGKALAFGEVLLDMAVLDPENRETYWNLYDQLILGEEIEGLNQGYTHFYSSDMSVYRRPEWMATLKMSSPRVIGAEVVNGENLLSYQMADGALFLYKTGREYENIFDVFDYTQVPGVTTNISSDTCAPFQNGPFAEFRGKNPFVGGLFLPDGSGGVSAMIFEKEGIRANKAWFFCEDYIICKSSGITGVSTGDKPVRTTVAQHLSGGESVDWYSNPHVSEEQSVTHLGTRYFFPCSTVEVVEGEVMGNWSRFATMYQGEPDTKKEVVSITINHGFTPENERDSYVIMPIGVTRGSYNFSVTQDHSVLGVEWIMVNGAKRRDAVFFEPGVCEFDDGYRISVSEPAIISVGEDYMSLSEPTRSGLEIRVTVEEDGKIIDECLFDTRGDEECTFMRLRFKD